MADEKVVIPEVPELHGALAPLPEAKRKEWREAYARGLKQAKLDRAEDPTEQARMARKEANRVYWIDEPTSYEEATRLQDWQLMARVERGGQLIIVTVHQHKRYSFPIPQKAATKGEK
jgi:aspartyl/asparaginyl beta-hydroxylase (cupin superfamily)